MKRIFPALLGLCLALSTTTGSPARATDATAPDTVVIVTADAITLQDFVWQKRPLVVFADSPFDPRYVEQMEGIMDNLDSLLDRDVVIITDTDPAARSAVREKLRPRGFMWVLIGKDGQVALRKPVPWDARELSQAIDRMPLRIDELREERR
ncbi:DUF4174 domain-containing protein [Mesobacterium sp. TK19101]|uniref:DUF4174 domain-containing protein n=1 Tax=Mesobacterium hydrothermale TaxID=3111907 RepID=A0ABU6HD82_9RHOB|nr:DUF4174 domain-containing protein [Mesobacterium sp. TK19101]MEC3860356.1 DUF4174 domain-containing protein [Mesobacterium sp. TK19101]